MSLFKKKEVIVAASGYFDPIHSGHIEYLEKAKSLGDKLIVIVNTDEQAIGKKGYVFMPLKDRLRVVKSLESVDEVFSSIDADQSVCKSLIAVRPDIFAKGGDRNRNNIPESLVCDQYGIRIIDNICGTLGSSSELVNNFIKNNLQKNGIFNQDNPSK